MGKIRVYEIAREMGLDNKELVGKIKTLGIVVNNHMSALDTDEVLRIKRHLEREKQTNVEEKWLEEGLFVRKAQKKATPPPEPKPPSPLPELRPPTPVDKANVQLREEKKAPALKEPGQAPRLPVELAPPEAPKPKEKAPEPTSRGEEKLRTLSEVPPSRQIPEEEPSQKPKVEEQKAKPARSAIELPPVTPLPTPKEEPRQPSGRVEEARPEPAPVKTEERAEKAEVSKQPAPRAEATGEAKATRGAEPTPPAESAQKEPTVERRLPPLPTLAPVPERPAPRVAKDAGQAERKQEAEAPSQAPAPTRPAGPVISLSEPVPVPRRETPAPPPRPAEGQANVVPLAKPAPVPKPVRQVFPQPLTTSGTVTVDGASLRRRENAFTPEEQRPDQKGKKGKRHQQNQDMRQGRADGAAQHARGKGKKGDQKQQKGAPAPSKPSAPITQPRKDEKKVIRISDTIVVSELAKAMSVKATDVLRKLISQGVMVTVNQSLDYETAALIASEFGWEVVNKAIEVTDLIQIEEDRAEDLVPRPPVVTIMGHVDHGKTTLLDALRKTNVAEGEAGGITQHIGAYQVTVERGTVVFLDTPGHEAFTKMRARGAEVTDVVVLVVGADDGVKPQTIEAIQHAKAAKVPIVVAINKIDKPGANPDRVKTDLMNHGVIGEEFGGDTIMVPVSAKQRINLDALLESILLQSELLELKANPNKRANGIVIESRLDKGRGSVATVLIKEGTLKVGDPIVCGRQAGRVRALYDDRGNTIESAGPSIPVEVIGFSAPPNAGDQVFAVEDESTAKKVAEVYERQARALEQVENLKKKAAGPLIPVAGEEETKVFPIVLKTDVQGSLEAVRGALLDLSTEKVKVEIVLAGVGGITESDVNLASTAKATIIGFNVRTAGKAAQLAEQEGVEIRYYNIIYDAVDETKKAMAGILEPKFVEKVLGRAEVRQLFHVPKVGTVAGCVVTDGKIVRGSQLRLLRDSVQVYQGRFASLRRFKDDVKEVTQGYECGISIENFNDLKVGDVIEAFEEEKVAPTLH